MMTRYFVPGIAFSSTFMSSSALYILLIFLFLLILWIDKKLDLPLHLLNRVFIFPLVGMIEDYIVKTNFSKSEGYVIHLEYILFLTH